MSSALEFLGLVADGEPGRYRFTVQNHLARLDARLYGGTAIAVSLAAAELVSERAPLWMTTQFVSTAPAEAEIAVHAEVLAPGRRTNQVRVTATGPRQLTIEVGVQVLTIDRGSARALADALRKALEER